jgi:1,2-diacylglycerol 3-beta-galactosyltransferase
LTSRVLFLFSDTGGGHRAAAEAIRDGLYMKYGRENIEAELLDVLKMSSFPMNKMPDFYPWIIKQSKGSWGFGYKLSNTETRAAMLARTMYIANRRRLRNMVLEKQVDVVVCVHSLLTLPVLRAWQNIETRPPFITVVTDLVTTHSFWYDKQADMTLVPTQAAFDKGIETGMPAEKMKITGLPVNPAFIDSLKGKDQAREALGWDKDKVTVLMVAGGDGMGPLYETAKAIDALHLDIQLAVVAGRNKILKVKLDSEKWSGKAHIYPFITNMPQLMDAADIIVTKAGPATICEAAIAGLPMILMDAIPGQEDGNVTHVIEHNAGAWAPNPQQVAKILKEWLSEGKEGLDRRSANARSIARPEAVWEIVDEVMKWAKHAPIKNQERGIWKRTRRFVSVKK